MAQKIFLGIDIGTYETKGVLVDNAGNIIYQAAKKQEMLIHATEKQIRSSRGNYGHGRWGHDFKFVIDPYGKNTGFEKELNRFTDEQKKETLTAYTPKNNA